MNVIDWSVLQITPQNLETIVTQLSGIVHIRKLRQKIVRAILDAFPWDGRANVIPLFDSSKRYQPRQNVALPHKEKVHSLAVESWVVGEVATIELGENPIQGQFDIVNIRIGKGLQSFAANVRDGRELSIAFPPKEDVDWDALVGEIEKNSTAILNQKIEDAISADQLARWQDDVCPTRLMPVLTEAAKSAIASTFASLIDARIPDYRTDQEIANALRERDETRRSADEKIARFAVNYYLDGSESYTHIGNGCWLATTMQGVDTGMNRQVKRRPDVPMVPSRIKPINPQFLDGAPESPDQVAGTEELLAQVGEEEDSVESPEMSLEEWEQKTSRGPLDLPKLTFQHLVEGFIPLNKRLNCFFAPSADRVLVHIKIVDDPDALPFWVDREQGVVKAHDPRAFFQKMQEREHPILPGVHLRIERMGRYDYRIAPIPATPHQVSCKIARWSEDGRLDFTIEPITVNYRCDRTLFKAEYRHWDKPALFREAEQANASIFDLVYETLRDWRQEFQENTAEYLDLFNAVFLKRQCSPATVAALLYSYYCFVRDGDGWKLDLDPQSIRTKQYVQRTRPERGNRPPRGARRKATANQQIPAPVKQKEPQLKPEIKLGDGGAVVVTLKPIREVAKLGQTIRQTPVPFREFIDRIFNCPRPDFSVTFDQLVSTAEYLSAVNENSSAGTFAVVDIHKRIRSLTRSGFRPKGIARNEKLEELVKADYEDHGRYFRLYLEVFTLLGYLGVGKTDLRRITSLTKRIAELANESQQSAIRELLLRQVLSIKFWNPYIGTKRNEQFFRNKCFRPASLILRYLWEQNRATTFELAVLFGYAHPKLAREDEILEFAQAKRSKWPETVEAQKVQLGKENHWDSDLMKSSMDPAFRFRNFLELMQAAGIIEAGAIEGFWSPSIYITDQTSTSSSQVILKETVESVPVGFSDLDNELANAVIALLIKKVQSAKQKIDTQSFRRTLASTRFPHMLGFPEYSPALDRVQTILSKLGFSVSTISVETIPGICFDGENDLYAEDWSLVHSEVDRLWKMFGFK